MASKETHVDIKASYGLYHWCSCPTESGYFLTPSTSDTSAKKYMIHLTIEVSPELLSKIQSIYITYPNGRGDLQHTTSELKKTTTFFFGADETLMGQTVYIRYRAPSSVTHPLSGLPIWSTVHEESIVLPFLNAKDSTCSICLEEVNTDIFISPCDHAFHISCLWDYFKSTHMLNTTLSNKCRTYCSFVHGKIGSFSCPICRNLIKVGGH